MNKWKTYTNKTSQTETQPQDNAHASSNSTIESVTTTNVRVNQSSTRRVALVIGNSAYRHTGQLSKPVNDAQDIGRALEKIIFR
ncbi:MAG: caspase family protein [Nitrosomonas sp.]